MRLAIGDIHGRNDWERYLREDFSEFYILGDYFDSPDISFSRQRRNFSKICAAARQDPRIKLCIGNHDYHYMEKVNGQRYSGFQYRHCSEIAQILEQNISLLKVLYVTPDRYIISHAGLSATFMEKMNGCGVTRIEDINGAFEKDRNILNFDGYEIHGDDRTQSPIWIRPRSLCSDPVAAYSQIVGHTPMYEISEVSISDPAGEGRRITITFINTESADLIYRF
jgi:hypothetical protein